VVNYRAYPDGHVEIIPDAPASGAVGAQKVSLASAAPAPATVPVGPKCPECKGTAKITVTERNRPLTITCVCPYCDGTGMEKKEQCKLVKDMEAQLG